MTLELAKSKLPPEEYEEDSEHEEDSVQSCPPSLKPSTIKEDDDEFDCYSIPSMACTVTSDTDSEFDLSDIDSDSDGMIHNCLISYFISLS